jgi:hypothetical protein
MGLHSLGTGCILSPLSMQSKGVVGRKRSGDTMKSGGKVAFAMV